MTNPFVVEDPPILDLTRQHAKFQHGDLTVILSWWWNPGEERHRPCLVLINSYAPFHKLNPCIVTLDKAWIWSEEIGDERQAAHTAVKFGIRLGLADGIHTAIRIRSLIVDHLGDLLAMPPMPEELKDTVILGDATVKEADSNRIVAEGEIITQH